MPINSEKYEQLLKEQAAQFEARLREQEQRLQFLEQQVQRLHVQPSLRNSVAGNTSRSPDVAQPGSNLSEKKTLTVDTTTAWRQTLGQASLQLPPTPYTISEFSADIPTTSQSLQKRDALQTGSTKRQLQHDDSADDIEAPIRYYQAPAPKKQKLEVLLEPPTSVQKRWRRDSDPEREARAVEKILGIPSESEGHSLYDEYGELSELSELTEESDDESEDEDSPEPQDELRPPEDDKPNTETDQGQQERLVLRLNFGLLGNRGSRPAATTSSTSAAASLINSKANVKAGASRSNAPSSAAPRPANFWAAEPRPIKKTSSSTQQPIAGPSKHNAQHNASSTSGKRGDTAYKPTDKGKDRADAASAAKSSTKAKASLKPKAERAATVKAEPLQLSEHSVQARLRGCPALPVQLEPATGDVKVDRLFMVSIYGGQTQTLYAASTKSAEKHEFLFPDLVMNPHAPRRPGEPGLLFRATARADWEDTGSLFRATARTEGGEKTLKVFVKLKPATYWYIGDYKFSMADPLTTDEFRALDPAAKSAWAQKIATRDKDKELRARIALRKRSNREPTAEEVEIAQKTQKFVLTGEDIIRAFEQGDERIHIWRMTCVKYNRPFQREVADNKSRYVPKPRAQRKTKGANQPSKQGGNPQKPVGNGNNDASSTRRDDDENEGDGDYHDEESELEHEQRGDRPFRSLAL